MIVPNKPSDKQTIKWKNLFLILPLMLIIASLAFYFLKFFILRNSKNNLPKSKRDYAPGEVIVNLAPYIDIVKLDNYLNANPQLSKKRDFSIPGHLTLSLKPYSEWQEKIKPGNYQNPEIQKEVKEGEALLHQYYDQIQKETIIDHSNIWDSLVSENEGGGYFAVIHVFFPRGAKKAEIDSFIAHYSDLEVVENKAESTIVTVKVPEGKEENWVSQFSSLPFVSIAELNYIAHID